MKLVCNQKVLSKALNTVSKAVSSKTTIPVLSGILLDVDADGNLNIAASDLDLSIKNTIQLAEYTEGSVVVGARLFLEIIRKLPNEDITIEEDGNNIVLIKTRNSEFTIVSFQADEFPSIGDEDLKLAEFSFSKDVFKEMIRKTAFSASIDEAKGILLGVLIEMKKDSISMVALDGFRMAIAREDIPGNEERKIVIAARILNEINKIISESEEDEDLKITLSEKRATIILGNTVITSRLLEGEYIKYDNIIPKDNKTNLIINKNEMIESIERASLLAKGGKNNLIRIKIKNNLLTLTSRSEEGNVKEEIIVEKTGDDIEIGFNSKYMLEALKAIDDEDILLTLNTSVTPALIKPVEGNAFDYLILPVRISSN